MGTFPKTNSFWRCLLAAGAWAALLPALPAADGESANVAQEAEYRQVLLADEFALEQIDQLLASNDAFKSQGAGLNEAVITTKVRTLIDPVREKYQAFLTRHSTHVKGHLAYASFLGQFGLHDEAKPHLERALKLAPNDPVALNNAGNYYGAHGPARKAFGCFQQAISLRPEESTYRRNLASVMLVHRTEARSFFALNNDQEVFDRVANLYRQAMKLKPDDFLLATDFAQSHYQLKPFPYQDAVAAWEAAFKLAPSRTEKEGIMIHLARIHIKEKAYAHARRNLNGISRPEFLPTKKELLGKLPLTMKKVEFSTSTRRAPSFDVSPQAPR